MFRKLYTTLLLIGSSLTSYAQNVGINNDNSNPDPSAMLDVKSTDKGVLFPRVSLTGTAAATPVTSPATGLLVYNTATVSDVTPGFYYWNGTAWVRLVSGASSGWSLTGNAGTTAGTNFLGTTDNRSLMFKTNNIKSGYIDVTTASTSFGLSALLNNTGFGNVGIGLSASNSNTSGSFNTSVGTSALQNNTTGVQNTVVGYAALQSGSSNNNATVGYAAMQNNTSGSSNVAMGAFAMINNTTGNYNVTAGSDALRDNTTGERNTAIGFSSMRFNISGGSNTALGEGALSNNTTGSSNTAIGSGANVSSNNLTNATAIGAGAQVDLSNKVRIGNVNVTTTHIAGTLTYNAQSATTSNTFPATRGTAGQVLTTDGAGNLSWSSASGSGWGLSGNAGTAAATNFLGTSDAQDFVVRTNNIERLRVLSGGGLLVTSPNANANALAPAIDVQGAWIRLGDAAGNQVFTNGMGIKFHDSGVQHASMLFTPSSSSLFFGTSGGNGNALLLDAPTTPTVTMDLANRRLGIGTNAPAEAIHAVGNVRTSSLAGVGNRMVVSDANGTLANVAAGTNGQVMTMVAGAPAWAAATPAWGLTGNAGTSSATNFIGTTDNVSLVFRTNNTRSGHIDLANSCTSFGLSALANNAGISNVAFGQSALTTNSSGVANTSVGTNALQFNTTGSDNAALGGATLQANTTGSSNTALGRSAIGANTTGSLNTALGAQAGLVNTTGSRNTFLGASSNASANNLTNATAVGANAFVGANNAVVLGSINGTNGATADAFVGIGTTTPSTKLHINSSTANAFRLVDGNQAAGRVLTSDASGNATWATASAWGLSGNAGTTAGTNFIGTTDDVALVFKVNNQNAGRISGSASGNNAFFGYQAGNVTTGTTNAFIGHQSGASNTTGSSNTALGYQALFANVSGTDNVALGTNAFRNGTGTSNVAVGSNALTLGSGNVNTAIGRSALQASTTANENTAVGSSAMLSTTNGSTNVAVGVSTMANNQSGSNNAAVGAFSFLQNVGGSYNTAMGVEALRNSNADLNTAVGYRSMVNNVAGTYNVTLGAYSDLGANNLTNAISIGATTTVNASNKVRIGNAAITVCEVPVAWTVASDKQLKTNVQNNVPGLDLIKRLQPVTYNYIAHGANAPRYTGLMAQDVEASLKEMGIESSIVTKPNADGTGSWGIRYAELTLPLIQAVKELDSKNKTLADENAELKAKLQAMEANQANFKAELDQIKAALNERKGTASNH